MIVVIGCVAATKERRHGRSLQRLLYRSGLVGPRSADRVHHQQSSFIDEERSLRRHQSVMRTVSSDEVQYAGRILHGRENSYASHA